MIELEEQKLEFLEMGPSVAARSALFGTSPVARETSSANSETNHAHQRIYLEEALGAVFSYGYSQSREAKSAGAAVFLRMRTFSRYSETSSTLER